MDMSRKFSDLVIWIFSRGGRHKCISSLHPRQSGCAEEPHPMGSDPICAEYSRSDGVNFEI